VNCAVTYEELAAFACGDLDETRQAEIREHIAQCNRCSGRLQALTKADDVLAKLSPARPSVEAILATRRALAEVTRGAQTLEIMTLEDVADFLRISPEELGQLVPELPAFELAGQLRVRRQKLIDWIQQRERDYARSSAQTEVARILADRP